MRVHPKYFVPNSFTALSMLFGLASVVLSSTGYANELRGLDGSEQFRLAGWLICWGVLLDKLDGSSARLMNASSEFGVQFDSFADFVVFGIAPGALAYTRLSVVDVHDNGIHINKVLLLIGVGFYVVATAMRLARFNISDPPGGDKVFYGIPTTFLGALVAALYLVWDVHGLPEAYLKGFPGLMLFGGMAMVSNVKLPKLKPRKSKAFNLFQIANIGAVYILVPLRLFPEYMLGLLAAYLIVGVGYFLLYPPDLGEAEPEADAGEADAG